MLFDNSKSIWIGASSFNCQRKYQQKHAKIRIKVWIKNCKFQKHRLNKIKFKQYTAIYLWLYFSITKESIIDVEGEVSSAPSAIESCSQKEVELRIKQVSNSN